MILTIMTQLWENRFARAFVIVLFSVAMFAFVLISPVKSVANGEMKPQIHDLEWRLINSVSNQENIMNFTVSEVSDKKFVLERQEGTKWNIVYEKQFSVKDFDVQQISAPVKAPSESGTVYYRVTIDNREMVRFKVENHNPNDFTDYEKKAYNFVEKYCANVYITTGDAEEMKEQNVMGLASTGENKIILRPGMADEDLDWVARHECGHILQHNAYDQNREEYPVEQKRSILWLNEELSPYYDEEFENERGTGYSEKNADCIAYYLAPDKVGNAYCNGVKGQAAYNIAHGKTALEITQHSNFENRLNIVNTGYAIKNADCATDTCVQDFENGTAISKTKNGEVIVYFDISEKVAFKQDQEAYVMPKIQDIFDEVNIDYFYGINDTNSLYDSLNKPS